MRASLLLAVAVILLCPPWHLTACVPHAARNITTNELANMHRYPYLRTKEGAFTNPCAPLLSQVKLAI